MKTLWKIGIGGPLFSQCPSFLAVLLLTCTTAFAWPWNSEPQPLLQYVPQAWWSNQLYQPITADAGSPLAWDESAKQLWYIDSGNLSRARWDKVAFTPEPFDIRPNKAGGLAVDSARHQVFYLNSAGIPIGRKSNGVLEQLGNEPLTQLLGVDSSKHWVFGFDANAGGIRKYEFDAGTQSWKSLLVAKGLGSVGDAAAIDSVWHVLYTTHETVDSGIARNPHATTATDPSGIGQLKAWPLVATTLSGTCWKSKVIDETGVPQQPAVYAGSHRVFYTRRDDLGGVHYYQPAFEKTQESFGSHSACSGSDTYVDNSQYAIKKPYFPKSWGGDSLNVIGFINTPLGPGEFVQFHPPITVVACYKPIWSESALAPRVAQFRAALNPAQKRLIQHRVIYSGETVRQQTGSELVGYLYRDSQGVLATALWGFPSLPLSFDSSNPPANFAKLTDPRLVTYASCFNLITDRAQADPKLDPAELPYYTIDPNNFIPPYLRPPSQVGLHTFGYNWVSPNANQQGGRYRIYTQYGTSYATPSAIAVDAATGVTFYTQAPDPASDETSPPVNSNLLGWNLPAIYDREVDPKLSPPSNPQVWIVMVY